MCCSELIRCKPVIFRIAVGSVPLKELSQISTSSSACASQS